MRTIDRIEALVRAIPDRLTIMIDQAAVINELLDCVANLSKLDPKEHDALRREVLGEGWRPAIWDAGVVIEKLKRLATDRAVHLDYDDDEIEEASFDEREVRLSHAEFQKWVNEPLDSWQHNINESKRRAVERHQAAKKDKATAASANQIVRARELIANAKALWASAKRWLTREDAAKVLRKSPPQISRDVSTGKLKKSSVATAKTLRITASSVIRLALQNAESLAKKANSDELMSLIDRLRACIARASASGA